ncbi:MAG: T9SS type A sorting domain-containing protein [Ignavibacteria bacterium]|nr:T9SS type A sorting domain-containing protein [Ignavibacteria bacterium]
MRKKKLNLHTLSRMAAAALFFILFISNLSIAQIFSEPFNYTPDAVNGLSAQSSGTWVRINSGDSILVTSGNQNYAGLTTGSGNMISYGGAGADYYRPFTNQTSGTVYASFLLNVTNISAQSTAGGYTFGYMENNSTSNFGATVWIRNNAAAGTTQYNIGVNPRTTIANTVWAPNVLDVNTTYMVVISYQIVAGAGNDIVKMWINPVSFGGTEPNSDLTATNTGTDLTTGVQRFFCRQDAAATTPTLSMDELRVGTTWAEVTPSIISASVTMPARVFNNITIDNAVVTLSASDTITGTLTMQNGGTLVTDANEVVFTNTATDPTENNTNRIIGRANMLPRNIDVGALNFLGFGIGAGGNPIPDLQIIRTTGPAGVIGGSIACSWDVITNFNTQDRTSSFTFPSVLDNGIDMTQAQLYFRGTVISGWYSVPGTQNLSGSDPRVYTQNDVNYTQATLYTVSDPSHVVPVELASFTSVVSGANVKLSWSTVYEENNSGFDIERKNAGGSWVKVANVKGNGTSNVSHAYSFEDRNLATGNYNYRLKQIDFNGNFEYFNLSNEVTVGVPDKFVLSQNYPNPFNPSTSINYELPMTNYVSLKIYDMVGKEVASLVNQNQQAGYYTVKFDGSKLSSGTYFYKIQAGDFSSIKKMMLVK